MLAGVGHIGRVLRATVTQQHCKARPAQSVVMAAGRLEFVSLGLECEPGSSGGGMVVFMPAKRLIQLA